MRMIPASCIAPLVFTALVGFAPQTVGAASTYIALGDSIAFGEYRFEGPSNGDRGYVAPYADALAGSNGGVRPQVINLAVDGETTTTFFNGGTPGTGPVPGEPAYALNTHYMPPIPPRIACSSRRSRARRGRAIPSTTSPSSSAPMTSSR